MRTLIISLIVFSVFISAACTTGSQVSKRKSIINQTAIQIKLDSVKSFQDLVNSQIGYNEKYQNLIDSLDLNNTDTVGFFIRPCFTHRGVFFKIGRSKCEEYYFNFSSSNSRISMHENDCKVGHNFFAFICDSHLATIKLDPDSVMLIPDCPVVLFTKLKSNFYYRKISGNQLSYFYDNSVEFRRLIKETVD